MNFEYKVVTFSAEDVGSIKLTKQINAFADEGWDLVNHNVIFHMERFNHFLTFKKQVY